MGSDPRVLAAVSHVTCHPEKPRGEGREGDEWRFRRSEAGCGRGVRKFEILPKWQWCWRVPPRAAG